MHIFEITTPGTWLDSADRNWKRNVEDLLEHLKDQFFEANAALNLFEGAMERDAWDSVDHVAAWKRRSQIRQEIERELGFDFSPQSIDNISFETEVRFKKEKWDQGHVPLELDRRARFIFARAFVYALDGFDKFLAVLSKEANIPPRVGELSEQLEKLFPNLRGVRNTSQHLEDRSRGLGAGKNPKPMSLQPVNNALVHAPVGGVLVLSGLNGNRFGCTMSDGHYGEVEISSSSVRSLADLLHEVLGCFKWTGPKQHAPRM